MSLSVSVADSDSDSDAFCSVHLLTAELRSLYVYFEINLIYASIHRRIRGSLAQQTVMVITTYTHRFTHKHRSDIRKASLTVFASLKTLLLLLLVPKFNFCTSLVSLSHKPFPVCFRVLPNTFKYIFTQGVFVFFYQCMVSSILFIYFCFKYFDLNYARPPIT